MPSTRASDSEMKSIFFRSVAPYCLPGSSRAPAFSTPSDAARSTEAPSRSDRLKPYLASTHTVITPAPAMSSTALMICTQVVPFMPPTRT